MDSNTSYFELQSFIQESTLDVMNAPLIAAMRATSIQEFGWPIGVVMDVEPYRPKPKDKAIEAVIRTDESFDTWSLNSKGDFYLLKTLFENKRDPSAIFMDVRLVRLLEALSRVVMLYKFLGAKADDVVRVQIKYGGLLNKVLKIANQNRMMAPIIRSNSSTDTFVRVHEGRLGDLLKIETLMAIVVKDGRELFQLFDSYELTETLANDLIKEHRLYQGVVLALSRNQF